MGAIRLERVSKVYDGGVLAVDDVSLEVPDGEFIVLVGPSGCGKSTLLRLIAGLEKATAGRIHIGDRDVTAAEVTRRVTALSEMLGLGELMERKPAHLSGGQRQRVAIGRALVREPRAFLLDEPLSNLDAKLRTTMRSELARLHERLRVTTVYVTHDQVEAMTLGDRVAVLRDGVVQQLSLIHI